MKPVQNIAVIDVPKIAHRLEEQSVPTELAAGFEAQMALDSPPLPAPMVEMAEFGMPAEAASPAANGAALEAGTADERESVAADGLLCPETLLTETPEDADAGGTVCPDEAATPAHVLPDDTSREPAPDAPVPVGPVQVAPLPGMAGMDLVDTDVADTGGTEVGTPADRVISERQIGAQAVLMTHGRADAPALRVEDGLIFQQAPPLSPRIKAQAAPAGRAAAFATEDAAGQSRDPALSVPVEGKTSIVSPATPPRTGSMPALPLGRTETEAVLRPAREIAEFWAAPPGFSLPDLLQAQQPVSSGVRPVFVSPEGLCRQVGEAVLKMQDDRIEIALSPEELGSVRLVLSRGEAGAAMTVWVERPEVLEILRRNAELLISDLQKSGLGDATLAFQGGSGDQGRSPADHAPDGSVARGDLRRHGADDDARAVGSGPETRASWDGADGKRLDIRV